MKLPVEEKARLEKLCHQFRIDLIETLHQRQTGHPGGSLSVLEILTTLYFTQMDVDPANPLKPDRDRLVLGKGHAAPALYRVLAEKGFFPVEAMATLRCLNTRLQGHPNPLDTPGVGSRSGPLGIGLSAALGMALALKLDNIDKRVYCVMGDGEINEGTVWEGLMAAVKFKADNLCAILDWNGVQLDGTNEDIMPMHNIPERFASFGWETLSCDGHDIAAFCEAVDRAKAVKDKPAVIICETVKGKGVSFMEGKNTWHGKVIGDEEYRLAEQELGGVVNG